MSFAIDGRSISSTCALTIVTASSRAPLCEANDLERARQTCKRGGPTPWDLTPLTFSLYFLPAAFAHRIASFFASNVTVLMMIPLTSRLS